MINVGHDGRLGFIPSGFGAVKMVCLCEMTDGRSDSWIDFTGRGVEVAV